ncbi:MAG: hypothetical protein GXO32_04180 [Crenarchaeota archaeon]|nr:hypothetical protein [Thermoproteota archaeon]
MCSARVSRLKGERAAEAFHRVLARVLGSASVALLALYVAVPRFEVLCVAVAVGLLAVCWWVMNIALRIRRMIIELGNGSSR